MASRVLKLRYQWWLVFSIATGLVGMHHLVGTAACHDHSASFSASQSTSASAHTTHELSAPVALSLSPAVARASAPAAATSHTRLTDGSAIPGVNGPAPGLMTHPCPAVLVAVVALAIGLLFAMTWTPPRGTLPRPLTVVNVLGARAPPSAPARLSELCVLRR